MRGISRIGRGASRLVVFLMLAVLAVGVRLAWGPVDVPMPERALAALTARVAPGLSVTASAARFDLLGREGPSGLTLRDMTLTDGAGRRLAAVPALGLSMTVGPRGAVLHGIRIDGARVAVARRADGTLDLGIDGLTGDGLALSRDGAIRIPPVILTDAVLDYRDEATGVRASLRADRASHAPDGRMALSGMLTVGDADPVAVSLRAAPGYDGGRIVEAEVEALFPPALAPLHPALAPLAAVDLRVRGDIDAVLAPDGSPVALTAALDAPEGGAVRIGGRTWPIASVQAEIDYAPDRLTLDFPRIVVAEDGIEATVRAKARQTGEVWRVTAAAPSLALSGAAASLTAGAVSVEAVTTGEGVTIEALAMAGPVLIMTQGGETLRAASLTATGRTEADGFVLDRISSAGIEATGHDLRLDIETMTGRASVAADAISLHDMALGPLTLRRGGDIARAQWMRGGLRVDRPAHGTAFTVTALDDLDLRLAGGRRLEVPGLTMAGRVAKGALTVKRLRAGRGRATLPALYDMPMPFEALDLSLEAKGGAVTIRRASLRVAGVPVTGDGRLMHRGKGLGGRLSLAVPKADHAALMALWPRSVAAGARRWAMRHVLDGDLSDVAVEARLGERTDMAIAFDFAGAAIAPLDGLPPLRGARGRGTMADGRLDIVLAAARVAVPGGGTFAVRDGRFSIPDLRAAIPQGEVALAVDGPARSVLGFLDHPPLRLVSPTGFDIETMRGAARGTLKATIPLTPGIRRSDLAFEAAATIRDFDLREPHTKARITGDTLAATVTPEGIAFRTDARIDGLSARLRFRQSFAPPPPGEPEGELTVRSYLTREDVPRTAGLDLRPYIDGVAALDATVDLYPGGAARFTANADLTATALDLVPLGWKKPDGIPVVAVVTGFRNADGAGEIESIDIRGAGVEMRGRAGFDADGAVRRADFERIALADLLDTSLRYRRGGAGDGRRIELDGGYLDLRRIVAAALDADTPSPVPRAAGPAPATDILARIRRVRLREGLDIEALGGRFRFADGRIVAADMRGRLNGRAAAHLLAERRGAEMTLHLAAPDAGAFLDAASVLEGATGGRLRLDARLREGARGGAPTVEGLATAHGIVIRDSDTLRRMLSGGAVSSLARRMLSDGLAFTKVELPFSGVAGRWSIAEGVAWGDALGLTLDGSYDIARHDIDLRGTLSPAYAINGALGAVPLLGTLLTGGEGEGMFGITFAIGGTTDAPRVRVNPVSALAPGFLRKIVSGVMDGRAPDPPPTRRAVR